jgi:hypothetical protein
MCSCSSCRLMQSCMTVYTGRAIVNEASGAYVCTYMVIVVLGYSVLGNVDVPQPTTARAERDPRQMHQLSPSYKLCVTPRADRCQHHSKPAPASDSLTSCPFLSPPQRFFYSANLGSRLAPSCLKKVRGELGARIGSVQREMKGLFRN